MGPRLPPIHVHRHRVLLAEHRPRSRYVCLTLNLCFRTHYVTTVVRHILIAQNKKLDESDAEEMTPARRQRIEDAARLEGLTFEEAAERQKGFRYLY